MSIRSLRYSQFANRIDVDAFEAAIGWAPETVDNKGNDIGYCPNLWDLHKNGDTTGKFAIHREKRVYNCWVCGGGSLLDLAMAMKDMAEEEAIDFLYPMTAEENKSDEDFLSEIDKILNKAKQEKPARPYFNEHVLDKWSYGVTWGSDSDSVVADYWLLDRGIEPEVAHEFRIGYDPDHKHLSRRNGEYIGPAIILPHFWGDRLVGWQRRWLDEERPKWVSKYTNTHDFPREETIYNYERVYLSPEPIVVVESVPTVLFLASLGIPAMATFGSNVSDAQIRLLRKCQQGLILSPDNDPPGWKWLFADAKRPDAVSLAEALVRFVPVRVTEPVGVDGVGNDLGDLVGFEDQVRSLVANAMTYL